MVLTSYFYVYNRSFYITLAYLIGKTSLRLVCHFLFIFNTNGLEILLGPGKSLEIALNFVLVEVYEPWKNVECAAIRVYKAN